MFNFAAAFSERIGYSRSTKVVRFVPDNDGDSSPEPARGGAGDETPGSRCRNDINPDASMMQSDYDRPPARWIQSSGDDTAGARARIAGQTYGPPAPLLVSRVGRNGGDSTVEDHREDPSRKGLGWKSLLPHRKFWRYRSTKVHPMDVDSSSSPAHRSRQDGKASARQTTMSPSLPSARRSQGEAVELRTCHATTNIELRSSNFPLVEKGHMSPVMKGRPHVPSNSRSQISWTERLRGLFAPRQHHRSASAVNVPFKTLEGSADTRPGELGNVDPRDDRESQSDDRALKSKTDSIEGFAVDVPRVHHHWKGGVTMTTRPAMADDAAPLLIPGVPQFDADSHSSPSSALRNGTVSSRKPFPSSARRDNSSNSSFPTPASLPPSKQDAVMTNGDIAFQKEKSVPKASPPPSRKDAFLTFSPPSECQTQGIVHEKGEGGFRNKTSHSEQLPPSSPPITGAPPVSSNPPNSTQKERGAVEKTGGRASVMSGGIISKPLLVKSTSPVVQQETGTHHFQASMAQANLSSSQLQSTIPDVTISIKMGGRFSGREERVALKIEVSFIFANLEAARAPSPRCRWVEILGGIIGRYQKLRRMKLKKKQPLPYTSEEIREMELNAFRAKEKLYLLKQMITAANFVQPQPGDEQRRLFQLICHMPPERTSSKFTALLQQTTTQKSKRASENLDSSADESQSDHEQGTGCPQLFQKIVKKASLVNGSSQETASKSVQTTSSNSRNVSTLSKPRSCHSAEQQKSAPPVSNKQPIASSQASSAHITSSGTSLKNSLISTGNAASASKTTQPKIAPSCLQKILPSYLHGPYPTIDSGDLEYIVDKSGSKVVLGEGDNGKVLLMRRHDDGTLLAVKRLSENRFRITVDKAMLREVVAMQVVSSSLFFPKLVGVIDNSSFAQEFLGDGCENPAVDFLKARYLDGLLTAREWMYVCRDVTQGLAELHQAGWVHSDLHCCNAMLCKNPPGSEVAWMGKIIDLGLAQPLKDLPPAHNHTSELKQCFYKSCKQVAPEVVEGKTQLTVKADIYSLGKLFLDVASESSALHSLKHLGLACMSRSPSHRPKLSTVLRKLDGLCSKMAKTKLPPLSPP